LKPQALVEGTGRAKPVDMYDAETIEAINCEQLVTATDRWLLRASRGPARRTVPPALFTPPPPPAAFARGSLFDLERTAVDHASPFAAAERTVSVRGTRRLRAPSLAIGLAIPSLFGLACGLAALL
jgi:hypothetical protein